MKSYVDLNQARKLAEILPLESADMCYIKGKAHLGFLYEEYKECGDTVLQEYEPCWSLSALLEVLPKIHKLKPLLDLEENSIMYSGTDIYIFASNPIDACYETILKLHELNLL